MSCNNKNYTVSFDEKVKGWTSFHSFFPDFMLGMNNKFFTFTGGNVFIHHSPNVERNTYYGVRYPSKISVMMNDNPSDIKELQAVSLEGNYSWESLLRAYVSNIDDFIQSSIKEVEFVKKEGIWYAYARRNEDPLHEDSKSTYGIGRVSSISGTIITVNGYSDLLVAGDQIVKGDDFSIIGTVTSSSQTDSITTIQLSSVAGLSVNDFIIGMKDPRIEGGNLRGYTMRFDLEIDKPDKVELFAVNAEVMKSFS